MRWIPGIRSKPKTTNEQLEALGDALRQCQRAVLDIMEDLPPGTYGGERFNTIDCIDTQLTWARNYLHDALRQDYRTREQHTQSWRERIAKLDRGELRQA